MPRQATIGPNTLLAFAFLAMALDIGVARITYGTVLPALIRELGLDYVTGGLLSTVNLAAYLAGTLAAPALGRRFPMATLARWGHLAFALGCLGSGLAQGPLLLGLARVVMGFGSGVGLLAVFVVVFAATDPARRGAVSAFVWSGIGFSIVASGLAAPWLLAPGGHWRWAFLLPVLVALAVGIAVGMPVRGSAAAPKVADAAASLPPRGYLPFLALAGAYLLFGVGYIAFATFVGTQLAHDGASAGLVVATWLALGLASMVGSGLTVVVVGRGSIRHAALPASLGSAAAGAAAMAWGGTGLALPAAILIGLGFAATPALVTLLVRERTRDVDYPSVFGFATVGLGIGQLVGPLIAGLLADRIGPASIMVLSCAAYGLAAMLASRDATTHRKSPAPSP